jgi:hypothetical protein
LGPPLEDPQDAAAEEATDNGATRKAIAESRKTETRKYELVYEKNRWNLSQDPAEDDEVARELFRYALSAQ